MTCPHCTCLRIPWFDLLRFNGKRRPPQPRPGRPTACRARRRGQPGHPRQQRPPLEPTDTHTLELDCCPRPAVPAGGGGPLAGEGPQPSVWQALELPPLEADPSNPFMTRPVSAHPLWGKRANESYARVGASDR
jgi:hypothetical protein